MPVKKSHVPDRSRTIAEHNRMKSFSTREFHEPRNFFVNFTN
jgi:hypothetical protein